MARRGKAPPPAAAPPAPSSAPAPRPGRPAGTKQPTAIEREDHILTILQLIAAGASKPEIVRWLTREVTPEQAAASGGRVQAKNWSVSAPTARSYYKRAWQAKLEAEREGAHLERTRDKMRFELLYRKGLELGDAAGLNVSRKAAERIALMNGSFQPAPPPPADPDDITDEEALDEIDFVNETVALIKRRGGILTAAQERDAIDVEAVPSPPSPDTVRVVEETGIVPRPGGN
jgi:hypothetical protein